MWTTNKKSLISIIDLKQKYKAFVDYYSLTNSQNSNSTQENYCYNKENVNLIVSFIYMKINNEFSRENLKNTNNINNNYINNDN